MIDFAKYNDYDNLEKLNITFKGKPRKDLETDIYQVFLEEPLIIQLPKSKLAEINEDSYGRSVAKYILEDDTLLEFLDNLDAHIINIAHKHSVKWFGQNLNQSLLLNVYENCYDLENNVKSISFSLEDDDLEELSDYNIDPDLEIKIVIDSISIFKKIFKTNLKLAELTYNDEINETGINFENLLNSQRDVCETNIVDESSFADSNSYLNDPSDLKSEVLELIKTKELEKETVLTNSKRVNTAGKTLEKRASDLETEIKSFKEQLNNL